MNSWDPQFTVDESLAEALIKSQFPELHTKGFKIKRIGEGFDNTIYQVNDRYVFRFPRREIAVGLLETERKLLPCIHPHSPLSIPVPLFYGRPLHPYPWPFLGYTHIKGIVPADLGKINGEISARLLGKMLKEIHHFPIGQALELGVPYDSLYRVDIERRKEKLKENMELLMDSGHWDWKDDWQSYLESLHPVEYGSVKTLCHGDLHIRNILVDEEHTISGIIDWGDVHIGNPAVDLSIVFSFLTKHSRRFFFEEYGNVGEELLKLARFKAVYTSAVLAVYGMDKGDGKLVSTSLQSIRQSLD